MLRINLLPAYIAVQKKTRATWWWAGSLLAVCIAAPLVYRFAVQDPLYNDTVNRANQADSEALLVEDTTAKTQTELQKIQPIQAKVDFVKSVQFYNTLPGLIYRNVARYTYRGVEYSSMAVQGDSLSINASVPTLKDVGRFYLTLFGNPDIKALSIKGMPNYQTMEAIRQLPPDARRGFPIQVAAQLVQNVSPPTAPSGAAGGGMGGMGMGMGSGMGSGMMGSGMMPPGAGSGAGAGAGAGAPTDAKDE